MKAVRRAGRGSARAKTVVPGGSAAPAANPALPHERDETVSMTGGVQSPVVQQAARDVKRGVKDTSGAVEANETYKRLKK